MSCGNCFGGCQWGEGKGEQEEKDLGVEQFREGGFFVLRWIGLVSRRELGGEKARLLPVESRFCRSERSCILRGDPLPLPVVVRIPGQLEGWMDGKW